MYTDAMKAGIIGASGYTGVELLRLLAGHPEIDVAVVTAHSHAGQLVGAHTPSLAAAYPGWSTRRPTPSELDSLDGLDVVFCALPHGESQRLVPGLRDRVGLIVDLAADFRLRDPALYPTWYGEEHAGTRAVGPGRLRPARAVPGRTAWGRAHRRRPVAIRPRPGWRSPRCCGTGWSRRAGSSSTPPPGVSGAGRGAKESLHFGTVDEDFTAYGLLDPSPHARDGADPGGRSVLFTPHLAPMVRGILATCYARPAAGVGAAGRRDQHALDGGRDGCAARGLRRRAFRRGDRRAAVDEGHRRVELRPRHGPGR